MMRFALVLAFVAVALPRSAGAEPPARIAIVPGTAVNLDVTRVDALAQDLADALRTELEVDTIAGLEVRRRLPDAGLPPDCVVDQVCIADVARRLDAQQLLFVVMIDTGTSGAIQVDTTWVDAIRHVSAARPALQVPSTGDTRSRFAAAATQLLPDARVRAKGAGVGKMSAAVPRHFTLPSYVTAGATAAGLAVGISLGLSARGKYGDCEDSANAGVRCPASKTDSLRRTALIADIGWAVAIGGTIATAVLYATSGEAPHLVVEPTPSGVAVSAVGSF